MLVFSTGLGGPVESSDASKEGPPRFTNRLAQETSPYLLLHAHNPVDWYPWGAEAFQRAKAEGKPIFLSIGYSSCHWCHVMERESFSDPEIADYLNEHFVNVKVDREERPDVDEIYMTALQVYYQMIGQPQSGGWPLSMFLTPDAKPFFGGTYFPPEERRGMRGFLDVAKQVAEVWSTERKNLEAAAEQLAGFVKQTLGASVSLEPARLERAAIDSVFKTLSAQYDPVYGGFGYDAANPRLPKFPKPPTLDLLVYLSETQREGRAQTMLRGTLDAMAAGGIHDHLGGGFHRYSTDRFWRVPHFEKMLYDNAQLARVYVRAFELSGEEKDRQVAQRIFRFIDEEMTSPEGAFYSALDADTHGQEGLYYTWTSEQIAAVLGDGDAATFKSVYGVSDPPNFEDTNVLYLPRTLAEAAEQVQIDEDQLREKLDPMRHDLLTVRRKRKRPLLDTKVLTGWNGLMIAALADAGRILEEPSYLDSAVRAAEFVLNRLRTSDDRLLHVYAGGKAKLNAYCDDYAFLVEGLLALHLSTAETRWLDEARSLTDRMIDDFWDEASAGFFFTSEDHESLLARSKDPFDSVTPSANSVAVRNLIRLAERTGDASYRRRAKEALEVFLPLAERSPASVPNLAVALGEWLDAGEDRAKVPRLEVDKTSGLLTLSGGAEKKQKDGKQAKRPAIVTARGVLSVDRLPRGGTFEVAAVVRIKQDWHINANPASPDFLIPTTLKITSDLPIKVEKVTYPKGEPLEFPGIDEPLKVYTGRVIVRAKVTLSEKVAKKKGTLLLEIGYQACDDQRCLAPSKLKVKLPVEVAPAGVAVKRVNAKLFSTKDKKDKPDDAPN